MLKIPKVKSFQGTVRPPGSKSIAQRALLLAALSNNETLLRDLPDAQDVRILRTALEQMGVVCTNDSDGLRVRGAGGPAKFRSADLEFENNGTGLRLMTAILAAGQGDFTLDGGARMRQRPIVDLTTALQSLGADLDVGPSGCPPVRIRARGLAGGPVQLSARLSGQFLSALLLVAPFCSGEDLVIELPEEPASKPYVDLTIRMQSEFGLSVKRDGYRSFRVACNGGYRSPGEYTVEADASSAAYFWAAGALPGCGPVTVEGISADCRQGDAGFVRLLEQMGAQVEFSQSAAGPAVTVRGAQTLQAPDVDLNAMPDTVPTLAVLALFAEGTTHIRNIGHLRVKETDRIRAVRTELEKLGAQVVEETDALHITPPLRVRGGRVETYEDHRMAMAFSLAAYGGGLKLLILIVRRNLIRGIFRIFGGWFLELFIGLGGGFCSGFFGSILLF